MAEDGTHNPDRLLYHILNNQPVANGKIFWKLLSPLKSDKLKFLQKCVTKICKNISTNNLSGIFFRRVWSWRKLWLVKRFVSSSNRWFCGSERRWKIFDETLEHTSSFESMLWWSNVDSNFGRIYWSIWTQNIQTTFTEKFYATLIQSTRLPSHKFKHYDEYDHKISDFGKGIYWKTWKVSHYSNKTANWKSILQTQTTAFRELEFDY